MNKLIIFADYVIQKCARDQNILLYSKTLAEKIDNMELIEKYSDEEIKIRVATVQYGKKLLEAINSH